MTTNEMTYTATSEHPCPSTISIDGSRLDKPCGADTIPPTPGTDEEGYYCPTCGLVSE
jgi:hypothetical protein